MTLILSGTNGLSDVDGSASTPAIRGTDTNTGIFFPAADTIAFAEGGAEVARFNSAGNFGIGLTSPTQRLHVFSSVAEVATLESNFNNSDNVQLRFKGISGERWAIGNNVATGGTGVNFDFYDLVASANRLRIDSSGNLLVGTTSNTSTLGVAVRNGFDANSTIAIGKNNGAGSNNYIEFFFGGASRGYIAYNGSGGINYFSASDYRLKENIAPMTGALAKVAALKPVTYDWKETGKASEGFIAHELQEVFPDAVSYAKDAVDAEGKPVYQGIDTSFLVATLTAAIQEQQALIESLTARIAALEAK